MAMSLLGMAAGLLGMVVCSHGLAWNAGTQPLVCLAWRARQWFLMGNRHGFSWASLDLKVVMELLSV